MVVAAGQRSIGSAAGDFSALKARLRLPLVVAPMFRVSGVDLVVAACKSGAIGCFPTANTRTVDELDTWLTTFDTVISAECDPPYCANLIIKQPRLQADLECLLRHRVEMVITSVGSPRAVVPQLRDAGVLVFADVGSLKHARQALDAGVDGLVLLSAGAGGQCGWLNGFAFVRAVRQFFQGPVILAGGISDGTALRAATVLGCDLGYMGTRFIATRESLAADWYKEMVVESSMDEVCLTKAFTGIPANMLARSIERAGLDPRRLDEQVKPQTAADRYGGGSVTRWVDVVSAGHSVSGADGVEPAEELITRIAAEFAAAGVVA